MERNSLDTRRFFTEFSSFVEIAGWSFTEGTYRLNGFEVLLTDDGIEGISTFIGSNILIVIVTAESLRD